MRHIRILALSILAALTVGAFASTNASAARCNKACQKTEQEAAAWEYFANCPVEVVASETCATAESFYNERWESTAQREEWERSSGKPVPGLKSYFTAGKVTVPLKYSIVLRGGLEYRPEENPELPEFLWVAPVGAPTIEPVAEPAISLKKGVNAALLSPSELNRFNYYTKVVNQTKTTATVELAGPVEDLGVYVGNLLVEEGTAFRFPVKVHLSNPFLGEDCYVGSNENPIVVPFTTGQSGELHGKAGRISFTAGGEILQLWGDTLVTSSFSSPGVENCGVDGGADEAIDSALGLPSATGNSSVLNGVLSLIGAEGEAEHMGK